MRDDSGSRAATDSSSTAPMRFARKADLKRALVWLLGYIFVACIPRRLDHEVFGRIARWRAKRPASRRAAELPRLRRRIESVLGDGCSDAEVQKIIREFHEVSLEDQWGRWRSSHRSEWHVYTEIAGLEHLERALGLGRGLVFWGMSFCGTLFPKIALARAGVSLTQLSAVDHGVGLPMTLVGKRVNGPLYCLPENRYLSARIYISEDGDPAYIRQVGDVLRGNGCVWIAGERLRAKQPAIVEAFGRSVSLPTGAPVLALRYRATLIPAHAQWLGRFRYRLTLEPPIELNRDLPVRDSVEKAAQAYATLLETRLANHPGDWDWRNSWIDQATD